MRILDSRGTIRRDEPDHGDIGRPEIERGTLRHLLLESLPETTVQWASKVTTARSLADHPVRHEVELADGSTFTTDLLIGADGAWPTIRPLVSAARPIYSGISWISGCGYLW